MVCPVKVTMFIQKLLILAYGVPQIRKRIFIVGTKCEWIFLSQTFSEAHGTLVLARWRRYLWLLNDSIALNHQALNHTDKVVDAINHPRRREHTPRVTNRNQKEELWQYLSAITSKETIDYNGSGQ